MSDPFPDLPPFEPEALPPAPPAPPAAAAKPSVKPVNCPNCGGVVNVRAAGTTVSIVCEHCGSTLDATTPDLAIIGQANAALKRPQIALGTRATLRGKAWEVVGYQERTDTEVSWCEYLLFNPYDGYAFLIDDGRRFSLGRLLERLPGSLGFNLVADGQNFSPFGVTYEVTTTFVVGEFYWRVKVGDRVQETDYVRPGTMLACEDQSGERTWTKSDLLDWGEAETAFAIPARRKEYSKPAPHEPSPYKSWMSEAWIVGGVAAVTLFIVSAMGATETQIAATNADVVLDGPEKTILIRDVTLTGARNLVTIDASAPGLDNSWVDIDYSLSDTKTQQNIDAYGLAEYYSGSDSDGRWTEGNTKPDVTISSVPGGKYDLSVTLKAQKWTGGSSSSSSNYQMPTGIYGDGQSASQQSVPVTVTVKQGGASGGNILLGLLLILIWPVIATFKHWSFETRRKAPISGGGDDSDDSSDDSGSDD